MSNTTPRSLRRPSCNGRSTRVDVDGVAPAIIRTTTPLRLNELSPARRCGPAPQPRAAAAPLALSLPTSVLPAARMHLPVRERGEAAAAGRVTGLGLVGWWTGSVLGAALSRLVRESRGSPPAASHRPWVLVRCRRTQRCNSRCASYENARVTPLHSLPPLRSANPASSLNGESSCLFSGASGLVRGAPAPRESGDLKRNRRFSIGP
jgi:hypothetical protein